MDETDQREEVFGWELQLNLHSCDADVITDSARLLTFVESLVSQVGMVAHGAPIIEKTAPGVPSLSGFTIVQLIETSSIVIHIVNSRRRVYANVFSCKRFDCEAVIRLASSFFRTSSYTFSFSQRA